MKHLANQGASSFLGYVWIGGIRWNGVGGNEILIDSIVWIHKIGWNGIEK